MPDPRFYRRSGPLTLARVAELAQSSLAGGADPKIEIADVAELDSATSADLTYVSDKSFLPALASTKARACLVSKSLDAKASDHCVLLECTDPRSAFAAVATALYPDILPQWPSRELVAPDSDIAPTARVASGAVIGARAKIGAGTYIGPNTVIGPGVVVGDNCVIGANTTLIFCLIGNRVVIHAGVQIGQDGLGFTASPGGPVKVPQLGRVIIHDDVEIGANCTFDRGTLGDTIIGRSCKFDNLVQIAHNVVMGQGCVVAAQAGIAGSCTIGAGVVIGPQVGIIDHLTIGAGAQIAGQSGVRKDVAAKETVMGYPAKPIRQFWREIAALTRLAKRG